MKSITATRKRGETKKGRPGLYISLDGWEDNKKRSLREWAVLSGVPLTAIRHRYYTLGIRDLALLDSSLPAYSVRAVSWMIEREAVKIKNARCSRSMLKRLAGEYPQGTAVEVSVSSVGRTSYVVPSGIVKEKLVLDKKTRGKIVFVNDSFFEVLVFSGNGYRRVSFNWVDIFIGTMTIKKI